MLSNNIEKKKHNYNNKTQNQLKTAYPFIKGIPPASNWSNHFTSLIFPGGKYLLYISNSFIIVLDLIQKNFSQILSSHKIYQKEKPNILFLLNKEKFASVINSGDIIIFGLNSEGNFVEDLKSNKLDKVCQNVKCGFIDYDQNLAILSNDNKIFVYSIQYEENYNIYLAYEIDNINNTNYFITDMLLMKINSNNYLVVSNNIGNIIIYKYDASKYEQILVINNNKKENIYNIIFDKINNVLYSINKSGTLNAFQLTPNGNNNLIYDNIINLQNKFNDQAINEFYLFFSISFINENNLLITSNQGRIFLFNIKNKQFKEIAENPHKNSIYSILLNSDMNQFIFFSSDYKISFFDIKLNELNFPLLNFISCINLIPSKTKILGQYNNKIYYLYQIQHKLYINSYDIKKEKNYLDSIQYKVKIKNKENDSNNYNLSLCKLIDEEKFLLINKKNEILIYNIEEEKIDKFFSFLEKDELIIDLLFNTDILYILYKTGKIIIYNTKTTKIEKYTISNQIEKGNLLYLKNGIIILIIKENKSELVQFYLLKNYIFIKLKEIKVSNDFFSYQYIFSNLNFFYFYANDTNLSIYYMNLLNQYKILKDINTNEIKYEIYLDIINKLKESSKLMNEKKYEFDSIFRKIDFNKSILKITNIAINDNLNMICSFNDGSVMYYLFDIDTKNQNNYIINKIIYKYQIKVNFLPINDSLFLNKINNNEGNNFFFVTTSAEQSLKITDPSNCNILNINFEPKTNSILNNNKIIVNQNVNNNYIINKSFTNLFSNYFFTQSTKEVKIFSDNFSLPENIYTCSIEVLIFSYFNEEEKNKLSIKKIIEYAIIKNKNKKQDSEYIDEICDYFLQKEKTNNKLIFNEEKNYEEIIDYLIEFFCYVECLLYIKYKNLGLNVFIQTLEKIKKSIYLKQLIQAMKIEKIIQYYKNNFNIICE